MFEQVICSILSRFLSSGNYEVEIAYLARLWANVCYGDRDLLGERSAVIDHVRIPTFIQNAIHQVNFRSAMFFSPFALKIVISRAISSGPGLKRFE